MNYPDRNKHRTARRFIAAGVLAVLALLTGCGRDDGSAVSATGTIEATEVTVSAQAGGIVQRIVADEGTIVRRNDTVLVIDAVDWVLQLRQVEGAYASANAQYLLALRGARREDIAQAEATFQSAETDLKRMEDLTKSNSIPQKQLDDARTRFTLAQQALERLRRGSRPEEVEMARGRMEQAKAQRDALQKKVSDCIVTAPINGAITKRFVERGELAGSGAPLFRIADLNEMETTIYVSEADLPRIALGQSADVRVDAFPDRSYQGRVVFISSVAEFTPKNIQTKEERTKLVFAVKLTVANPDGSLKSGIPADVTITAATK